MGEISCVVWPLEIKEQPTTCYKCGAGMVDFGTWEDTTLTPARLCRTCWEQRAYRYSRKAAKRGKLRQNQTWRKLVAEAEWGMPKWLVLRYVKP